MARHKVTVEVDAPDGMTLQGVQIVVQEMLGPGYPGGWTFNVPNIRRGYIQDTYYLGGKSRGVFFTIFRGCDGRWWCEGIPWGRHHTETDDIAFTRGPYTFREEASRIGYEEADAYCEKNDIYCKSVYTAEWS